jgi:hypothetical protein
MRSVGDDPPPMVVDVPDLQPAIPRPIGSASYRRSFNLPTGLAAGDTVWLAVEGFSADSICVLLNDKKVFQTAATGPMRVDITPYLESTNQLLIRLRAVGESPVTLSGAVTLQIESSGI